jgi:hypothetical protein
VLRIPDSVLFYPLVPGSGFEMIFLDPGSYQISKTQFICVKSASLKVYSLKNVEKGKKIKFCVKIYDVRLAYKWHVYFVPSFYVPVPGSIWDEKIPYLG